MKKLGLLAAFLGITLLTNAQKFDDYDKIKLKVKDDFYATEDKAIECCDYIFTCKLDDPGKSRENAVNFMLRWAMEAPYDFIIQPWGTSLAKKHPQFIIMQLASLVKFQLQNKEASEDDVQIGAATLVYNYIKDPQFRVEQKGYVKKFVKAGDTGTLSDLVTGK